MNPQPLSSFRQHQQFTIFTSATRVVEDRPEHAALAAKIIGQAAFLDFFQATMLITFLGADAAPSFAMYDAIHQTAKFAALKAAAHKVLPAEESDMFTAITKFAKAVDKHRNRIAHGIWITCTEVPDGFVVVDPEEYFRFMVKIGKRLEAGERYYSGPPRTDFDYKYFFNYTKKNLADVIAEYATIHRWMATLKKHVGPKIPPAPHDLQYAQLMREPRLLKELARIRGEAPPPDQ